MKILLAEDDNDMRRFLVRALQNAGYDVASFDNGLSAYNRLREEPFELLLRSGVDLFHNSGGTSHVIVDEAGYFIAAAS